MIYNSSMKKIVILIGILALALLVGFGLYNYNLTQKQIDTQNICQDDDLIARLIVDNSNPFSKFKFIKKRNTDCKVLLITNSDLARNEQKNELCSFLDASTNSVTMLIFTYVNDMYDRENAAKEYKSMLPLMMPYSYCPQYLDNMYTLVKVKKRLGL